MRSMQVINCFIKLHFACMHLHSLFIPLPLSSTADSTIACHYNLTCSLTSYPLTVSLTQSSATDALYMLHTLHMH